MLNLPSAALPAASNRTVPTNTGIGEALGSTFSDFSGFSGRDRVGRWSDGPNAAVTLQLPSELRQHLLLRIRAGAFAGRPSVPEQRVGIAVNGVPVATWTIKDPSVRSRVVFVDRSVLRPGNAARIEFDIPTCAQPRALGINDDARRLGICLAAISWEEVAEKPSSSSPVWHLGRLVGAESRKSFDQKLESGFWERYIGGSKVLDIGFKGALGALGVVPIVEGAIGIDLDYPGYDGRTLPFGDNTQDAVYSSHCLEHIPDYIKAIQEWHRVVRVGGHIITVVPSMALYERRRRPPSKRNLSHARFYTPSSLLAEFEQALAPNTYRIRHLAENDAGYDYESKPELPPQGCYEIELVVEKIQPPAWNLEP